MGNNWYSLSAHFGGPKFIHTIENNKSLLNGIKNNTLFFGPLSAFITHSITGKPAVDESIACRTLMYNLRREYGQNLPQIFLIYR